MSYDEKKLKEELSRLRGEYSKTIILPGIETHGVEIEFAGPRLNVVKENVRDEVGQVNTNSYKTWSVIEDLSVTKKEKIILESGERHGEEYEISEERIYGGEIISRILQNDEQSWDELSRVFLRCLEIEDFGFNDKCAFHVHFGKDNFKNKKFIANLFKAYMIFEDIIFRTGYGETSKRRPDLIHHATLTSYYIYNRLNGKFDDEERVSKFLEEYAQEKEYGLNLKNYIYRMFAKKYTIEMRCANHLKSRFLMQNTIRIFANFLLYCNSTDFDDEFMDYYIEKKLKLKTIDEYEEEDFDKAILFAELFIKDEKDRLYFLKQYLKCYQKSDVDETIQKRI